MAPVKAFGAVAYNLSSETVPPSFCCLQYSVADDAYFLVDEQLEPWSGWRKSLVAYRAGG